MRKMILFEAKRAYCSIYFASALFVGLVLAAANVVLVAVPQYLFNLSYLDMPNVKNMQMASFFANWMGVTPYTITTSVFYYALPLLACIPFAASLREDLSSRYASQIVMRMGRARYFAAKLVVVFMSSGTVVILPILLNIVAVACLLPQIPPDPVTRLYAVMSNSMLAELFYSNPWCYIAIFLVLTFVGAGVYGLASVALSFFVRNRFAVLLAPFIVCVMIELVTQGSDFAGFSPIEVLLPAQTYSSIFSVVVFGIVIILVALTFTVMARGLRFEEL